MNLKELNEDFLCHLNMMRHFVSEIREKLIDEEYLDIAFILGQVDTTLECKEIEIEEDLSDGQEYKENSEDQQE